MSNTTELTPADKPDIVSIERFQALEPGHHWRALKEIPEQGITENMVLLLQSVRMVDDQPHTMILRAHPSLYGKSLWLPTGDSKHHVTLREHRFLVVEFLNTFEFCDDADAVRQQELMEIQASVNEQQQHLLELQSDPAILAGVLEERMPKDQESPADSAGALVDPGVFHQPVTQALSPTLDSHQVERMKGVAEHQMQIAQIKGQYIQEVTANLTKTIHAMAPFYEEQAAAALARTEDVRTFVGKLKDGIESLDLYIGKNVHVETIRSGESAPASEPLSVLQRKLIVEEELALYLEVDQWFDFRDADRFDRALNENPSLVEQIFPTQRCILSMAMRRTDVDYKDPWSNMALNAKNKVVFLMIRDGENLYRV